MTQKLNHISKGISRGKIKGLMQCNKQCLGGPSALACLRAQRRCGASDQGDQLCPVLVALVGTCCLIILVTRSVWAVRGTGSKFSIIPVFTGYI